MNQNNTERSIEQNDKLIKEIREMTQGGKSTGRFGGDPYNVEIVENFGHQGGVTDFKENIVIQDQGHYGGNFTLQQDRQQFPVGGQYNEVDYMMGGQGGPRQTYGGPIIDQSYYSERESNANAMQFANPYFGGAGHQDHEQHNRGETVKKSAPPTHHGNEQHIVNEPWKYQQENVYIQEQYGQQPQQQPIDIHSSQQFGGNYNEFIAFNSNPHGHVEEHVKQSAPPRHPVSTVHYGQNVESYGQGSYSNYTQQEPVHFEQSATTFQTGGEIDWTKEPYASALKASGVQTSTTSYGGDVHASQGHHEAVKSSGVHHDAPRDTLDRMGLNFNYQGGQQQHANTAVEYDNRDTIARMDLNYAYSGQHTDLGNQQYGATTTQYGQYDAGAQNVGLAQYGGSQFAGGDFASQYHDQGTSTGSGNLYVQTAGGYGTTQDHSTSISPQTFASPYGGSGQQNSAGLYGASGQEGRESTTSASNYNTASNYNAASNYNTATAGGNYGGFASTSASGVQQQGGYSAGGQEQGGYSASTQTQQQGGYSTSTKEADVKVERGQDSTSQGMSSSSRTTNYAKEVKKSTAPATRKSNTGDAKSPGVASGNVVKRYHCGDLQNDEDSMMITNPKEARKLIGATAAKNIIAVEEEDEEIDIDIKFTDTLNNSSASKKGKIFSSGGGRSDKADILIDSTSIKHFGSSPEQVKSSGAARPKVAEKAEVDVKVGKFDIKVDEKSKGKVQESSDAKISLKGKSKVVSEGVERTTAEAFFDKDDEVNEQENSFDFKSFTKGDTKKGGAVETKKEEGFVSKIGGTSSSNAFKKKSDDNEFKVSISDNFSKGQKSEVVNKSSASTDVKDSSEGGKIFTLEDAKKRAQALKPADKKEDFNTKFGFSSKGGVSEKISEKSETKETSSKFGGFTKFSEKDKTSEKTEESGKFGISGYSSKFGASEKDKTSEKTEESGKFGISGYSSKFGASEKTEKTETKESAGSKFSLGGLGSKFGLSEKTETKETSSTKFGSSEPTVKFSDKWKTTGGEKTETNKTEVKETGGKFSIANLKGAASEKNSEKFEVSEKTTEPAKFGMSSKTANEKFESKDKFSTGATTKVGAFSGAPSTKVQGGKSSTQYVDNEYIEDDIEIIRKVEEDDDILIEDEVILNKGSNSKAKGGKIIVEDDFEAESWTNTSNKQGGKSGKLVVEEDVEFIPTKSSKPQGKQVIKNGPIVVEEDEVFTTTITKTQQKGGKSGKFVVEEDVEIVGEEDTDLRDL
jgi:hypothetical protein